MADPTRIAAGWYPDPSGLPQLRWWDGRIWTRHTSDAVAPTVAAVRPEPDRADTAPVPVDARFSGGDASGAPDEADRAAHPEKRAGGASPRPLDRVFDEAFTAQAEPEPGPERGPGPEGGTEQGPEPEPEPSREPEPEPEAEPAPSGPVATARLHLAFDEVFGRPDGRGPR